MTKSYTKSQLVTAINNLGIDQGDFLFCHSNVGFLGFPEEADSKKGALKIIFDSIFEVIGEEGSLVVPTYTYSFGKGEVFDPQNSISNCGMFSEFIRCSKDSIRSIDPSVSVAAVGANAESLLKALPTNAYSDDGLFARLLKNNFKIFNINFDAGSTFLHYVERLNRVPYRYDKTFCGKMKTSNGLVTAESTLWVRDLDIPGSEANFTRFNKAAVEEGLYKRQIVGRGIIGTITTADSLKLLNSLLEKNVNILNNINGSE